MKKEKMKRIEWKNSFILRKFKIAILLVLVMIFSIIALSTYFVTKHVIEEQVKNDLIKQFMGVNKNIITSNVYKISPITSGIIENNEIVYITKNGKPLYETSVKSNNSNLVMVNATGLTKNNRIVVKLYVDMEKRVEKYFGIFYKFVIPLILIFGLLITLFSILLVKRLTDKLNKFIDNVGGLKNYGLEYNDITVYETGDEVGILSKEFNNLVEELRRMNNKQRQFVNDAAHELRTPLSIIEGNLNLLDKRGYSAEGKNVAKELVMSSIYTARTIVEDMLDLTHEEIIVKEKLEPINISEVILEIIDDYKNIYENYTFKTDIDNVVYPIRKLDIAKLANILLENAVKYSTKDLKEIEVKIKQKGLKIFFIVTDYGIGMTRENAEKAFDLFWTGDKLRSHNKGRVGIGLTIAKKICTKYCFKINVASEINIGTTVTVELKN